MEESNKTVNEENQVTDELVSSINTYFSHFNILYINKMFHFLMLQLYVKKYLLSLQ